jgi:hypothetical protein
MTLAQDAANILDRDTHRSGKMPLVPRFGRMSPYPPARTDVQAASGERAAPGFSRCVPAVATLAWHRQVPCGRGTHGHDVCGACKRDLPVRAAQLASRDVNPPPCRSLSSPPTPSEVTAMRQPRSAPAMQHRDHSGIVLCTGAARAFPRCPFIAGRCSLCSDACCAFHKG